MKWHFSQFTQKERNPKITEIYLSCIENEGGISQSFESKKVTC